ncbi:hypothetical protein B0H17DRAFT_955354 [Mycena rosella]|uniref:Reverse transcriptase domain-containing protein n=1 Tax=Mycena rosella TaxID=1033263 RepID=A0AAD7CQF3_MYCRO|nr:hypothetical protein B0H17DRAFT_955354 [Mycena rosella]
MYAAGVSGPFFDWMCMVYAHMVYATKYGNEHCLPFRSLIGLLTGDSASPTLWNIFFADFRLHEHPDDVQLHGHAVSQAEQADNNIIMSTFFAVFQAKVTAFFEWCKKKCVFISARKSKWMIFGPLPPLIPTLRLGDLIVELMSKLKYVGIWLTSTTPNIFSLNYSIKASKARNASNAAFAMKHRIRSLPIKEGLMLYMVRIDCYLISGGDIAIDVDAGLVSELMEAQHLFLHRLLGIHSRSMLAVLFTETGLMPIRTRCLLLTLGRLRYMTSLGDESTVRAALLDSVNLFATGFSGWAGDVAILLSTLPMPICMAPADFLSVPTIDAIIAKVLEVVDANLQFDIDHLQKTHLLRNHLETVEDKLELVTRRRRHYLTMVLVPAHRKALTGLLLGDHTLSVEQLRCPVRYRRAIPREERLCRFCHDAVEDEVHALLDCDSHVQLVELRDSFLTDAFDCDPVLEAVYALLSHYDFLRRLISSRKAVSRFAKYTYDVLNIYDRYQPLIPEGLGIP